MGDLSWHADDKMAQYDRMAVTVNDGFDQEGRQ
jgi:hypothetical protein